MKLRPLRPLAALLLATSCIGNVGGAGETADSAGPTSGPATAPPSGAPDPGATTRAPAAPVRAGGLARLRRLTRTQLENSLRDLLGDLRLPDVEPDSWQDGFASIGAASTSVSPAGVEQYEAAIASVLDGVFASSTRRAALVGCMPSGSNDAACMRAFVTAFGRRAWRGPLEAASIARFTDLGTTVAISLDDFYVGARHAAAGLLQSPGFLYRVELATVADPRDPTRRRFPSRAMASRLSYLLWNTTPDADLLAAVDRDELATADGVRAQADRLLRSPRASAALGNFAQEMFQLYRLDTLPKDPKLFPQMTPALRTAMTGELVRLYQRTVERDIDATELFDTAEAAVTADLAKLYGLPDGVAKGTAFTPVTLPADGVRAGVLGTSALLALYAKQNETSPTARGRLVREALLCQRVPDPPGDVDTTIKDPPPGVVLTTREKFEMHRSSPTCAACHGLLDPIGFALESFDPIGAFRATDHGKPIDASGALDGHPFANARDLGRVLRGHPDARQCLARQLYRYAAGHRETADEDTFIAALGATTAAAGGRMKALLLEMVSSDAFRYATP